MHVCLLHISQQNFTSPCVMCIVLVRVCTEKHSSLSVSFLPPSYLSARAVFPVEVEEKHNLSKSFQLISTGGAETCHCSAQFCSHIFSAAEPAIIQGNIPVPTLLLTQTHTHTHTQRQEDLADRQIRNQSQSRQRDTEADQPNKTAKLRCEHQNYFHPNVESIFFFFF